MTPNGLHCRAQERAHPLLHLHHGALHPLPGKQPPLVTLCPCDCMQEAQVTLQSTELGRRPVLALEGGPGQLDHGILGARSGSISSAT